MNGSIRLNEKTGKYDFVFDAGKHPLTGKRIQIRRRGFKDKKLAQKAMVQLAAEYSKDEHVALSSMTYEQYMEEWFKERKILSQKTTLDYETILYKNVISKRLGHFKLQQIQPMHIQNTINEIVADDHYAPRTIRLIFQIINGSLKRAKTMKLIKDNPAEGTRLPKIKKRELSIWTTNEVNLFITKSRTLKRVTRCRIGYIIIALSGCRQGEALGIRWSDIDFTNGIIHIKQTVTQDGVIKTGAKNDSSIRSIHIPSILVDELLAHKERIESEKQQLGLEYNDHNLVICTQQGKPIIPRNFRNFFYQTTKRVGLPQIRVHDLRHTHATMLIEQNVNVKLISSRLGHASIKATLDIYSHVLPSMDKSIADELEKIIKM
ncbi:TPA: tyrosine-type recombinase/integrase [Bacillus mobilis]|uniref:site-specific integrase n=1 Tax=Bacillus mobilis TaxID=2026190 RepID=UPI00119D9EB5|nr:site-specific integrase [Bacillus mobilis]MED4384970.1 site-specific integrase [Bacillus mobilis]HDX9639007.1 site-specific integrase [Bacillus mobilis]